MVKHTYIERRRTRRMEKLCGPHQSPDSLWAALLGPWRLILHAFMYTYHTVLVPLERQENLNQKPIPLDMEPIIDLGTRGTVCLVSLINSRPGLNLFAISFTLEKGAFLGRLKTSDLQWWCLKPESIDWFIEDQDFLPPCDLAPPPPPIPFSPFSKLSLFQSSCVSPVKLSGGRRGRKGAKSYDAVLRNPNYFLQFRFRLLTSSGSGFGSTLTSYGSGSGSISRP